LEIPYSTLTRIIREARLDEPVKKVVGFYQFLPGEEMQFDTSPHKVILDGKTHTLQCASLVFAYSRRIFVAYYHRFTRFEAKCFLHDALVFMDGSCRVCMIDNTSVVLAGGSGNEARISPEMEDQGRSYGYVFKAHPVGNPERKGRVERSFRYAENNFLVGRLFRSLKDLNEQACLWCDEVNARIKRVLGMSPLAAYIMEKPHLVPLPRVLPPVYDLFFRQIDNSGMVNLETIRYSVPWQLVGKKVEVYKYPDEVRIAFAGKCVASHRRVVGQRDVRVIESGHQPKRSRVQRSAPSEAETVMQGDDDTLDRYLKELKRRVRGRGVNAFKRLLHLRQTYPRDAFLAAVENALHFGLFDLQRLEKTILEKVAGDFFQLDIQEVFP
jgi:hypothetical protein